MLPPHAFKSLTARKTITNIASSHLQITQSKKNDCKYCIKIPSNHSQEVRWSHSIDLSTNHPAFID